MQFFEVKRSFSGKIPRPSIFYNLATFENILHKRLKINDIALVGLKVFALAFSLQTVNRLFLQISSALINACKPDFLPNVTSYFFTEQRAKCGM